jgi:hypothetical protein
MIMGPITSQRAFRFGKLSRYTAMRVEKSCGIRALPYQENSNQNADMESAGDISRLMPSHGGTQSDAPFRHISRLDSAFVAQVLGQVLMEGRNRECPRYVPARLFPVSALLLDERV